MERDAQPELEKVLGQATDRFAPVVIEDGRKRGVAGDAKIIAGAERETEPRLRTRARALQARQSHATAQEPPASGHRVIVGGEGCVSGGRRDAAVALRPAVRLTTEQQIWAEGSTHLQVAAERSFATDSGTSGARKAQRPVTESKPDPETLPDLGVLCRRHGDAE